MLWQDLAIVWQTAATLWQDLATRWQTFAISENPLNHLKHTELNHSQAAREPLALQVFES